MPRRKKSAGFDCDSLTSFDESVKNSSELGETKVTRKSGQWNSSLVGTIGQHFDEYAYSYN